MLFERCLRRLSGLYDHRDAGQLLRRDQKHLIDFFLQGHSFKDLLCAVPDRICRFGLLFFPGIALFRRRVFFLVDCLILCPGDRSSAMHRAVDRKSGDHTGNTYA